MNDIGEGESTIQCWICPICFDDHNQDDDKKCRDNLKADKEKLQEENKLFRNYLKHMINWDDCDSGCTDWKHSNQCKKRSEKVKEIKLSLEKK